MGDRELTLCLPCESNGDSNSASMYCIDCAEPLCQTCVSFHKKLKSLKTHKLTPCSKENTGRFLDAELLSSYLFCPNHSDKAVEIKCDVHNTLCCLRCATVHHRTCQKISEIDTIAEGYKRSEPTEKIRTRLKEAMCCIEQVITVNENCRMDFEKSKEEIPKQLKQLKTKFLKLFEGVEFFILKRVNVIQGEEDITIGNREETWKLKLNSHIKLLRMLESLLEIGTDSQVYVVIHKIKEILAETEKALANQVGCITGQRLNLNFKEKLKGILETDTTETLVNIESVQNQYQLPKAVENSKKCLEYETKLSSDTLCDNESNLLESDYTSCNSKDANKEENPLCDVSSHEMEVSFSGLDSVKICHFFKTELMNLEVYYHAKVTRDPPEGPLTKVTIEGDEQLGLGDQVKKMQGDLKGLSEEVVQLDVTKVDKVKDIVKQYPEGSSVLVYINPVTRNVHVVAGDYEKLSQALHQVKEDTESDGFNNLAKSRMYNKKDSKTLDLSISVTPGASNVPAQEEGVNKKAKTEVTKMGDSKLTLCLPCESNRESKSASMYCIDCAEPLCHTCVSFHKKFKSSKTHKLTPCSKEITGCFLDASYLFCPNHSDKAVEIKCDVHNTLCCLRCATVHHRTCQKISEIDMIAEGYKRSEPTEKIKTRLEETMSCIEEVITVNENCRMDFEKSKEEIPKQLEQLKTKILKLFEEIEFFILKRVNVIQGEEDTSIGNREEIWKLKLNSHIKLLRMLESLLEIGTDSQVYVVIHRIKEILAETEKALANQGGCITGQRLNLNLKEKLQGILETDTIETLVNIESVQNQYQLPKTVENLKQWLEYETKLSSDTLCDNESNILESDCASCNSKDSTKEEDSLCGNVRNKPDVLKSCGKCVLEALKDFCQGKSKRLMEVHLVNNTEDITNMMRDVFEKAERATKSGAYQKPKTGAPQKAVTSFQEKGSRDGGHFSETMNETRTRESFRSNVTEDKESDGFDNLARSRMHNKNDSKTLDLSISVTPSASNVPAQEEGVKKKAGNLRIFDDPAS